MVQSDDLRKRLARELDQLVDEFCELEKKLGDAFKAQYEHVIQEELEPDDDVYNYIVALMYQKNCSLLVASAAMIAFRYRNPDYEVVFPARTRN
jgi:hypothetical protein